MKSNYSLLFFNFVISIFMLFSLNSFSTSDMYLPALFLYFLSNIATFIDKYISYKETNQCIEQFISAICFLLTIGMVCIYIFDSLGFVKITFQNSCDTYRMLIQGVPNSFFTFNSVDITPITLLIASLTPIAYIIFIILSALRDAGLTQNKVFLIIKNNKFFSFAIPFLSIIVGLIGKIFCHIKYKNTCKGFGQPQYSKYFWLFTIISFTIFSFCFLMYNRNKEYS